MSFYVVCEQYQCGPFRTLADAERRLTLIEASGECYSDHRVTVVKARP